MIFGLFGLSRMSSTELPDGKMLPCVHCVGVFFVRVPVMHVETFSVGGLAAPHFVPYIRHDTPRSAPRVVTPLDPG